MRERPPGITPDLLRDLRGLTPWQQREVIRILTRSLPLWRRVRVQIRRCSRWEFGALQLAMLAPLLFLLGAAFWNAVAGWSATG